MALAELGQLLSGRAFGQGRSGLPRRTVLGSVEALILRLLLVLALAGGVLPVVGDQLQLLRLRVVENLDDLTLARVVDEAANVGIAERCPELRLAIRPHIYDVLVRPGLCVSRIRIPGPVRQGLDSDHSRLRRLPVTPEHVRLRSRLWTRPPSHRASRLTIDATKSVQAPTREPTDKVASNTS